MPRKHKCDEWTCDGCGTKTCLGCGGWADEVYGDIYCSKCKENEDDYKAYKEELANRKPRMKRPKGKQTDLSQEK